MKEENDKKLVESFPLLYADRRGSMRETCMCWGFSCGDGWFDIVWRLSEKLEKLLREYVGSTCGECGHDRTTHHPSASVEEYTNARADQISDRCNVEEGDWECHCNGFEPYVPRASQVKEKFGTLRFYMTGSTSEMEKAIEEAETASGKTCELCGGEGALAASGGWYSTLCSVCRSKK